MCILEFYFFSQEQNLQIIRDQIHHTSTCEFCKTREEEQTKKNSKKNFHCDHANTEALQRRRKFDDDDDVLHDRSNSH